jgi:hypothetical protein
LLELDFRAAIKYDDIDIGDYDYLGTYDDETEDDIDRDREDKVVRLAMALQKNTTIRYLCISSMLLTMTAWKAVIEMLGINQTTRELFVDLTKFDLLCARLLATKLPFCSSLKNLHLKQCEIGIYGCYAVVTALCDNPNGCQLECLDLCGSMQKDSGDVEMKNLLAEKFVLLLQLTNTKLRHIDLANNKFGDDFVTMFVAGLKHNLSLERLDL